MHKEAALKKLGTGFLKITNLLSLHAPMESTNNIQSQAKTLILRNPQIFSQRLRNRPPRARLPTLSSRSLVQLGFARAGLSDANYGILFYLNSQRGLGFRSRDGEISTVDLASWICGKLLHILSRSRGLGSMSLGYDCSQGFRFPALGSIIDRISFYRIMAGYPSLKP